MSEPLFLSVGEAAELLGISDRLVYELIARGDLPAAELGRRKVVPRRAIELVLERALEGFDPDRLLAALAGEADSSTTPAVVAGGSTSTTGPREEAPHSARFHRRAPAGQTAGAPAVVGR